MWCISEKRRGFIGREIKINFYKPKGKRNRNRERIREERESEREKYNRNAMFKQYSDPKMVFAPKIFSL